MASDPVRASPRVEPLRPLPGGGGGFFLERTLRELTHGLEATLDAEETARLPGLLQRLDPRAKMAALLALLLAGAFAHRLEVLVGLCLVANALALLGRLPLTSFLRRVWTVAPLFAAVIALPAVCNVITPGHLVVEIADLGTAHSWWIFSLPQHVGISEQGLRTAATLILRVGTSVALAVLLVTTTRWARLLHALEMLHLPKTVVLILAMTYRYTVLLLRSADAMFLARQSRRVGPLSGPEQRRWVAGASGALLGKSYQLSNEVYLAMLSRGFRGEVRLAETLAWRGHDWLAVAFALALAVLALGVDRAL
ncbi:MAG: cobalt ECF transporter T component CbiQ [Chloroflexi bacterium]|nr:cobalt ECF transporter T component CbiQ [Chloroflexota bacterium]